MAEKKKRAPIIRWRGVLANDDRVIRAIATAFLIAASGALAFTQLGFAGIGTNGEYGAYAIVLLLPVALASLLLGTLIGTGVGFITGVIMYAHAELMPLDYYEITFVTPVTSIGLLTLAGLLSGILFAFVLRNNPGNVKRVIYIVIVCFLVSWLTSSLFLGGALSQVIVDLSDTYGEQTKEAEIIAYLQTYAARIVMRLGDVTLQTVIDALLMSLVCCIGDVLARKLNNLRGNIGVRSTFALWLSTALVMVFMATSVISFVTITNGQITDFEALVDEEATYLGNQLKATDRHIDSMQVFLESTGITESDILDSADLDSYIDSFSTESILEGYSSEEDGIVVIGFLTSEGLPRSIIMQSNDKEIEEYSFLADCFTLEILEALQESHETGTVQRAIYDKVPEEEFSLSNLDNAYIETELVYVYTKQIDDYFIVLIAPASMVFEERDSIMMWTTLAFLVLMIAVFAVTTLLLSRIVVRRIDETNSVLSDITKGNLDARVDITETREFDSLSQGINETVDALKGWIAEAESRMDAELATAKAIQESALPQTFPPYPDILKFDIYATMKAAKEVGGDFYDFFLIGDDSNPDSGKLGFVMADVSGKGVPAALFMMKAKTQIRDYLVSGMEIGEAIENANRQLCDGNDAGMFVTAWVGILDYETGHIDYVNAGHNPPLLWHSLSAEEKAQAQDCSSSKMHDGSWQWLEQRSGLPLGLFSGFPYEAYSLDTRTGDTLLLYTDGVTEAMSVTDELYGEDRLEALASANYTLHPRMLVDAVKRDVAEFAKDAIQSDDITIMALEVGVPPEVAITLTVPASVDELPHVNEFIHEELEKRLCPLRAQNQLDIAVEELFVNVAHYAYPDATPSNPGTVRVSHSYSADPPSVTIEIVDEGIPYNPLEKPDAVTPTDIMEVPIGGLGVLMAKKSVDNMTYERVDNFNVVTITKKW